MAVFVFAVLDLVDLLAFFLADELFEEVFFVPDAFFEWLAFFACVEEVASVVAACAEPNGAAAITNAAKVVLTSNFFNNITIPFYNFTVL